MCASRLSEQRIAQVAAWLLPILLVVAAPARAQELPFVHYTTESQDNPLPSAAITGVHQDALGYVWFSVFSSGLVRYDGSQMELYAGDDGLRDLGVYRVVEDRYGRLWSSSQGGVVASDRPLSDYGVGERVHFTGRIHDLDLPQSPVNANAVAADSAGFVWIGATGIGLLRIHASTDVVAADTVLMAEAEADVTSDVTALLPRRDGSLWIATYEGALYSLPRNSLEATLLPARLRGGDHVTAMVESSGEVLMGTSLGELIRVDASGGDVKIERVSEPVGSMITSIVRGRDGSFWVGSEGSGLQRIDLRTGKRQLFDERHGLLGKTIHEATLDDEGNLWFAQLGGISKLRPNFDAFRTFTGRSHRGERPSLPALAVGAVAVSDDPDAPCPIWAGTSEGGIACISSDGTTSYLQSQDGLRSDWVNALLLDERGALWIGSSEGIQRLSDPAAPSSTVRGKSIRVGSRSARLEAFGPRQISIYTASKTRMPLTAAEGETIEGLWFAGWDLFSYVGGRWFLFGAPAGLPQVRLHGVAVDDSGRLWVGTQGAGIYRTKDPVSLETLSSESNSQISLATVEGGSMHASVVQNVLFESVTFDSSAVSIEDVFRLAWINGTMWAATAEGIFAFEAGDAGAPIKLVGHLARGNGLGADLAMSLTYAPSTKTLWVGTNSGLAEIDPATRTVIRTLSTQDGLANNEGWYTGSLTVGADGAVYFGSAQGLTIYRPAFDHTNKVPPRVRLQSAQFVEGDGTNEFVARYSALTFAEESRVRYRTRLVGFSDEWSDPHADTQIRYTNLPAVFLPKTYVLEVVASNNSCRWLEEPLQYSFSVPPPAWLKWWAMAMYVVFVGAAVAGVHRIQHRRVVAKERERARIREAELRAETALARTQMAEAASRALEEENRLKEAELEKARELEQAYETLKITQAQLIQSEKLASLGQLTAGIAHEIKNPLNFVTNFASLANEILEEIAQKLKSEPDSPLQEVEEDLSLVQMNVRKVEEHGRRADGIVKSMLEHSRGESGERQPTEVNTFLEQYVNLAYQGERARTPNFNLKIERSYDEEIGSVDLIQQEVGRVLVNLLDNAFYAVRERSGMENGSYEPTVSVSTQSRPGGVEITLRDNGTGIPESIRQKIFEPFFTTKPPGKGTGLGLSLSHNIIVQGCGGEFLVESEEGEGTTFRIRLPKR